MRVWGPEGTCPDLTKSTPRGPTPQNRKQGVALPLTTPMSLEARRKLQRERRMEASISAAVWQSRTRRLRTVEAPVSSRWRLQGPCLLVFARCDRGLKSHRWCRGSWERSSHAS